MENFTYHPERPINKGSFGLAETERSCDEIYKASEKLADYICEEEIKNIFFLDNSARQAYVGLKEIWKKEHAEEKEPGIYFINPDPLKHEQDFEYCAQEFTKHYKNISQEERVLIYDVCVHSGNTLVNVKNFLDKMGFEDVRLAVTSIGEECSSESRDKLDLVCLENRASGGCQPFGKQTYIKRSGSLISSINANEKKRQQGQVDHEKIKEVFKRGLRLN